MNSLCLSLALLDKWQAARRAPSLSTFGYKFPTANHPIIIKSSDYLYLSRHLCTTLAFAFGPRIIHGQPNNNAKRTREIQMPPAKYATTAERERVHACLPSRLLPPLLNTHRPSTYICACALRLRDAPHSARDVRRVWKRRQRFACLSCFPSHRSRQRQQLCYDSSQTPPSRP